MSVRAGVQAAVGDRAADLALVGCAVDREPVAHRPALREVRLAARQRDRAAAVLRVALADAQRVGDREAAHRRRGRRLADRDPDPPHDAPLAAHDDPPRGEVDVQTVGLVDELGAVGRDPGRTRVGHVVGEDAEPAAAARDDREHALGAVARSRADRSHDRPARARRSWVRRLMSAPSGPRGAEARGAAGGTAGCAGGTEGCAGGTPPGGTSGTGWGGTGATGVVAGETCRGARPEPSRPTTNTIPATTTATATHASAASARRRRIYFEPSAARRLRGSGIFRRASTSSASAM